MPLIGNLIGRVYGLSEASLVWNPNREQIPYFVGIHSLGLPITLIASFFCFFLDEGERREKARMVLIVSSSLWGVVYFMTLLANPFRSYEHLWLFTRVNFVAGVTGLVAISYSDKDQLLIKTIGSILLIVGFVSSISSADCLFKFSMNRYLYKTFVAP